MLSSGKDCVNSFKNSFCYLRRSLSVLSLAVFTCFAHRAVERQGLLVLWCLSSATRSAGSTTTSGPRAKYRFFLTVNTIAEFLVETASYPVVPVFHLLVFACPPTLYRLGLVVANCCVGVLLKRLAVQGRLTNWTHPVDLFVPIYFVTSLSIAIFHQCGKYKLLRHSPLQRTSMWSTRVSSRESPHQHHLSVELQVDETCLRVWLVSRLIFGRDQRLDSYWPKSIVKRNVLGACVKFLPADTLLFLRCSRTRKGSFRSVENCVFDFRARPRPSHSGVRKSSLTWLVMVISRVRNGIVYDTAMQSSWTAITRPMFFSITSLPHSLLRLTSCGGR